MQNKSTKEKINECSPEYCPECGYDRSQDVEKHKCSQCGCHTPPQDFPPDIHTKDVDQQNNPINPIIR